MRRLRFRRMIGGSESTQANPSARLKPCSPPRGERFTLGTRRTAPMRATALKPKWLNWMVHWWRLRKRLPKRWITFRSEEHTSELQSLMRKSYAGFCLKNKSTNEIYIHQRTNEK